MVGVGPAHALPSTCLQKVEEQPEDTDNQRNVTRMGSQPPDPSATVQVPVMQTSPPGETTVVPSEYLPNTSGSGPPCAAGSCSLFSPAPWQVPGDRGCLSLFSQLERVVCYHICAFLCPRGALWPSPVTSARHALECCGHSRRERDQGTLAGTPGSSGRQTTTRS